MKLYVEGGGDSNPLRTECRKGFSAFLEKAGLKGRMPRIVACGSRNDAYDSFVTAVSKGESAMLLVDSESAVEECNTGRPWQHLLQRQGDEWSKPENASEEQCHLMVQCMEAWLLADREGLAKFFGNGFNMNALPATGCSIESISKQRLYSSLEQATRNTKVSYSKGGNSFKLLAKLDANKVIEGSAWAERFVNELKKVMS